MHFPELRQKFLTIAKECSIRIEDIDEHHTHGHGHGGQKVNKSTNCVELHHLPTGITVRYAHHRSLTRNRVDAYELLFLKIQEELQGEVSELARKKHKIQKQKQRRSRRAKEKILEEKKKRSDLKEGRKTVDTEECS